MKKTKQGISLIVLVITIIVMIILAAAIIISLNNSGIINKANEAVSKTDETQLKEMAQVAWGEAYLDVKAGNATDIVAATVAKIRAQGYTVVENEDGTYTANGVILTIDDKGVEIVDYDSMTDEEYLLAKYNLKIGDQVIYNEGTGYTTTLDSNFAMTDMNWYVLGVNKDRQVELISDKATESTLYLYGGDGWLNGPTKMNTICKELYGNGNGADSARSLTYADLEKLAGVEPTVGDLWQWRYSSANETFECRISTDGGKTYTAWTNYNYEEYGEKLNFLGKGELNSSSTNVVEVENTLKNGNLSLGNIYDNTTWASFLSNGLNTEKQCWLATQTTYCHTGGASYRLGLIWSDRMA